MLSMIIKELEFIVQDKKLPFQAGCVITVFATFEAFRFYLTDEIMHAILAIGYLIPAASFFIVAEIKNSAIRGVRMRYWVTGVGISCSIITGIIARFYS